MEKVVILSAKRTPIGKLGGELAGASAVDLGVTAARAAIKAARVDPEQLDQAIFGNVLQAGSGQNVARQIGLKSGMANRSTAMTVNEVCGSGLKAIRLGQAAIQLGEATAVLVGGTESMSQVPYYAEAMRAGHKFGDTAFVDGLSRDGLNDAFSQQPMGITAENIATRFEISRRDQDEFALRSHLRAAAAAAEGRFKSQMAPVTIAGRHGDVTVETDSAIRPDTSLAQLAKLPPVFEVGGTVTAGNASGINDGAAALILMAKSKAEQLGLHYLATITDYTEVGIDPDIMGYAPKLAIDQLLQTNSTSISSIDQVELNEAFASQSVAVMRDLGLTDEQVNINGGALALGHPLGASGARIMVSLLYNLAERDEKTGIAALCVGGGIGIAMQVVRHV
ncbi:acetyl-CoA C-acyltransferase [Lacticaseibacillus casei]|jgi:acetyl-CoA C-acetyltransferase|uniref:acetyl-CoA C-acetyltransferase n=1 Tax=Lacticaseibacillus huelsenbergensis TaxID=3035291 RepID=A0ABY8DQH2_9LACO|nr:MULTISPECIES: acetyl-CoA C-acyltransferase [Lacticaseibacillus]MDG3060480.1 acetyl-CoA C-acyltransferase [Lacticaseibacillus sp. BCRC 81376]QVI37503.1 acetyl-CoA C-acyltransferase [Lacticaseibacillus casei]QXG59291.1 acetyl-CoA C-acyltransferase [Lacticaseibacillus casei]WFB39251.1 acetyl-CoA C-acyltransferase [Lacticaseibacillus huelsenbergensis]WFB40953.1 acetyl-CoA C-acyltransferase [Lacticaseibacillus huelsenbergensis]